jgi:hypothetical protein
MALYYWYSLGLCFCDIKYNGGGKGTNLTYVKINLHEELRDEILKYVRNCPYIIFILEVGRRGGGLRF